MRDLLFDVPWWLPTLLAIIGIALLVSGNRRQKPRMREAGFALLGVAIAWAVVSYLVDTPKEICIKNTRRLVQSAVERNWSTFDGLMDRGVDFRFSGSSWEIKGRDALDAAFRADMNKIGLKSAHITHTEASENGETITVTMKVWSVQDITLDRPVDSAWQLDWRQSGGRWYLHEIRAVEVSGMAPEQVRDALPGG